MTTVIFLTTKAVSPGLSDEASPVVHIGIPTI